MLCCVAFTAPQWGVLSASDLKFFRVVRQISRVSVCRLLNFSPRNRIRSAHGHHRTSADLSARTRARSCRFAVLYFLRGESCSREIIGAGASCAGEADSSKSRSRSAGKRFAVAAGKYGAGPGDFLGSPLNARRSAMATSTGNVNPTASRSTVAATGRIDRCSGPSCGFSACASATSAHLHEATAALQSLRKHRRRAQRRDDCLRGMWLAASLASRLHA
jgi:hypothetical protein